VPYIPPTPNPARAAEFRYLHRGQPRECTGRSSDGDLPAATIEPVLYGRFADDQFTSGAFCGFQLLWANYFLAGFQVNSLSSPSNQGGSLQMTVKSAKKAAKKVAKKAAKAVKRLAKKIGTAVGTDSGGPRKKF